MQGPKSRWLQKQQSEGLGQNLVLQLRGGQIHPADLLHPALKKPFRRAAHLARKPLSLTKQSEPESVQVH